MIIFEAICITAKAADTIFQFATFTWTKKNVIKLAVTTAIFVGSVAYVAMKAKKEKNSDADAVTE
jgi:hypothetical protein